MADTEPTNEEEVPVDLTAANQQRARYLNSHQVPVPMDEMYLVSLLEFALGDKLPEAKEYHERRIAPILDNAVANLVRLEEARAEMQEKADEEAKAQAARSMLLGQPIAQQRRR